VRFACIDHRCPRKIRWQVVLVSLVPVSVPRKIRWLAGLLSLGAKIRGDRHRSSNFFSKPLMQNALLRPIWGMEIENSPDEERTLWHPAFIEALQMELEEYHDALEFHPEFQLSSGPLRIDCVVVRKTKDVQIKKNIAAIFREWNLIEYKSPGKTVSVENFYKVYAYACLYISFQKVPVTGVTVTFVGSRFSKKLLNHLRNERGYSVAETGAGIYTVRGDILPIQLIDSSKLPLEENLWLKNLSNDLHFSAFRMISAEIYRQDKAERVTAYLHVITRANLRSLKEAIKMSKIATIEEVEELLEETGLTAKWEARGEARSMQKAARNALAQGASPAFVQKITGLDMQTIDSLKSGAVSPVASK